MSLYKSIRASVFLFGVFASSVLGAAEQPLQDENGQPIVDLHRSATSFSDFTRASIGWNIANGQEAVYPRLVSRKDGFACVTLGTTIKGNKLLYDLANGSSSGALTPARDRKAISCGGNSGSGGGKYPTFNLYTDIKPSVLSALGFGADAEVRAVIDSGTGSSEVQSLPWKLQARNGGQWTTIGGLNIPTYTRSGWVRDPQSGNDVALLLVAESTGAEIVVELRGSQPRPSRRNTAVDTRLFSIQEHQNARGYLGEDAIAPVIAWRNGESADSLRLEVNSKESEPSLGRYCVVPVYYPNDDEGYLFSKNPSSGRYLTQDPAVPGSRTCNNNEILSFMVSLELDATGADTVRFIIDQKDNNLSVFDLQEASVLLRQADRRVVLSEYKSGGLGKWYQGANGTPELYVPSSSTSVSASNPLALKFSSDDPGKTLLVDGATLAADETYMFSDSMELSWDDTQASVIEIKVCEKSLCREVLDTFTPYDTPASFDRDQFAGLEVATFEVVWGAPGEVRQPSASLAKNNNASEAAAQPENAEPIVASAGSEDSANQLRLNTNIQFGNYSKPLTTCVGRMVHASDSAVAGEAFTLQQGNQIVTEASWPSGIEDDTKLQILFDRKRNGDSCSVGGLVLEGVSRANLMEQTNSGEITLSVEAPAPLFVGYLQLNSQEYKKSRARWLDSLSFFNRFYEAGKAENDWIDALMLGAGDSRGEPRSIIELDGNFTGQLGSDAQREAVVETQVNRSDILTDSFGQSLDGIQAIVGDAEIAILYFDDSMESFSCDDYALDIADSGLNVKKAVVITSKSNYTGDDSLKSLGNGLAHICAQEGDSLLVFAFDSSEQHKERQWDETFGAIYENLAGTESL